MLNNEKQHGALPVCHMFVVTEFQSCFRGMWDGMFAWHGETMNACVCHPNIEPIPCVPVHDCYGGIGDIHFVFTGCQVMRSARAAMTVAGNACAKKDAKSDMK
jgi:hypothetical protein